MDFFGQQAAARTKTKQLVLLFSLAVLAIIVAVDALVGVSYWLMRETTERHLPIPIDIYIWATLAILCVIGLAMLWRTLQLSAGGGEKIAELAGGRKVLPNAQDRLERRLINVVEEMAIAAGIRVPAVYVLDNESSINAFAAGYSPNQATVAVTRGCLERLNRDELQGVIAHEFSHILNGDMRLNIRLIGLLFGIVAIATIGSVIRDVALRAGDSDSRSAAIRISAFAFGLMLWIIGSIGILFGRLIKAAVSRQREFLADASAVQFTRNKEGIGGALRKIGGLSSAMETPHAEEFSHLFLGAAKPSLLDGWLATHPPITERVKRIYGRAMPLIQNQVVTEPSTDELTSAFAANDFRVNNANEIVTQIGQLGNEQVGYAAQLTYWLPASIKQAMGSAEGARAIVYSLIFASEEMLRAKQRAYLTQHEHDQFLPLLDSLAGPVKQLGRSFRFPVLELLLPALRLLPISQRQQFISDIEQIVTLDQRIDLDEFVFISVLEIWLLAPHKPVHERYHKLSAVAKEIELLLSLLAHADNGVNAQQSFALGASAVQLSLKLRPHSEIKLAEVKHALDTLNQLALLSKPAFIKACVATAMADSVLHINEAELIRMICAALDTPLPPLINETMPRSEER